MQRTAATGGERERLPRGPGDYRGYEVRDPLGQKIGTAVELFVNGAGGPEYVRVRLGLFGRTVLIPVTDAAADDDGRALTLK